MKFDSGSLWYLKNENLSTTESWTDENFDLKNPRYEEEKKIHNFALRPFCQIRADLYRILLWKQVSPRKKFRVIHNQKV